MKIKYILVAVMASVGFSSCELLGPIDEINPDYVLTDKTLITGASSAEAALAGIYSNWADFKIASFRHQYNSLTQVELMAPLEDNSYFILNDVREELKVVEDNYTSLYKVVNMANSVISIMESKTFPDLNQQRHKEIVAEAYYNRAQAHFMLLRQYGSFYDRTSSEGVVIMTEPKRDNQPQARNTVEESYQSILADLDTVIMYGPSKCAHYYAGKLTGKALKSRVLLYMNEYAESARLAGEVIAQATEEGYSNENKFMDVFAKGFNSSEVMFSLHTIFPQQTILSSWFSFFSFNIKVMQGERPNTLIVAEKLAQSAETYPDKKDLRFDWIYSLEFQNTGIGKYPNADDGTTEQANTFYFFRLAEVYLIKAEAEARLGNFKAAREALKPIVLRAGYAEEYVEKIADAQFLETLFLQKWMELHAENNEEWFDIVRYTTLDKTDFSKMGLTLKLNHLKLPIPRAALGGNNLLIQNAEYVTKQ